MLQYGTIPFSLSMTYEKEFVLRSLEGIKVGLFMLVEQIFRLDCLMVRSAPQGLQITKKT